MSNVLEQMLEASKEQLELEFEHKKELAQIKSCQNNEIKELKQKYKKKIADLEANLAESEIFYKREINRRDTKLRNIKQQLAEKDKAIENWQTMYESVVQTCHNDKEEIERLREINLEVPIKQLQFHHNQDKISFAVEQLEKVKKKFEKRNNGISQATYSDNFKDGYSSCCCDTTYSIDNQIKQLKEGK